MSTYSKGAFRSKTVWGAILTLVGAFGLLPFGVTFNPETGLVSVNIYDILNMGLVAAIPGGAALSWFGRVFGTKVIRGLW